MKKSGKVLFLFPFLMGILFVTACQCECECESEFTPEPSRSLSQTITSTPGIEQILAIQTTPKPTWTWLEEASAMSTFAATDHGIPTEVAGYPSPEPPIGELHGEEYPFSYSGDIHFIDDYVIRRWWNWFTNESAMTISSLNQPQEVIIEPYLSVSELSGVDVNQDGFPEYILYTSKGGNVCAYGVLIYSLGDDVRLLNGEIARCNDYFEDVNQDGVAEYITTRGLPLVSGASNRKMQVSTIWQYDKEQGYVNVSENYPEFYQSAIDEVQINIDKALNNGANPRDYVYHLAMIYVYSGRKAQALEVMEKYLDDEALKKGCEYLLDLEYCNLGD